MVFSIEILDHCFFGNCILNSQGYFWHVCALVLVIFIVYVTLAVLLTLI